MHFSIYTLTVKPLIVESPMDVILMRVFRHLLINSMDVNLLHSTFLKTLGFRNELLIDLEKGHVFLCVFNMRHSCSQISLHVSMAGC